MRSDGPLLLAIVLLGIGVGVLVGFGIGHTEFNVTYPLATSMVHFDLTTTGPGVLGAAAAGGVGALFLVWAFLGALVSLISGPPRLRRERVVERISVMPSDEYEARNNAVPYADVQTPGQKRHFWSRHSERPNL
jgi:hypothetical protein